MSTWMMMNHASCQREYKARPSPRKDVEKDLPREKSKKSQGKRIASFASESTTKKLKKWSWTSGAVVILLNYIKPFKTKCEFNGVDFEADLSTMCAEIRGYMAVDFPEGFGPDISDLQIRVRGRLRVRVLSSEHAHFEKFRPPNLKRVLST